MRALLRRRLASDAEKGRNDLVGTSTSLRSRFLSRIANARTTGHVYGYAPRPGVAAYDREARHRGARSGACTMDLQ